MSDFFEQAEALQKEYAAKLPPVEKWNPPLSGDIDIRIARDGRWYHEGSEIQRQKLVRLFSTILKREGDDYFLVTPVEKWRIQVEDAPFVVVDFSRQGRGADQKFVFKTGTDDIVVADQEHPLWVETRKVGEDGATEESVPYIIVRKNLPALISRNVYYHLIEVALEEEQGEADRVGIRSCGETFYLS
ncbi:DUF1285 domain-containing protein [Proteobacteria bacterium 005FR1]|nr:DUF1285 domain-containing protein [Proteobacteria bacterium 005FR1]